MATVDIFGNMSYEYLGAMPMLPKAVGELAPSVKIHYIGIGAPGGADPVPLTANLQVLTTHHLSDPLVAPGKLDIVLVPGVDPTVTEFPREVTDWLAGQAACETTDLLCVCTAIFLFGAAGLLKGKKASGPRGLQDEIKKRFGDVQLVGDEYRWWQDGRFWSSGTCPFYS
jgi:transcriptional regulator GlxA family with amidase domain